VIPRTLNAVRSWGVLALVFALALASIAAVTLLQQRSDTSRVAQLRIATITDTLNELQSVPIKSFPSAGGSQSGALALMHQDELRITQTLAQLRSDSAPAALQHVLPPLQRNFAVVAGLYALGVQYAGVVTAAKPKPGAPGNELVSSSVVVRAFEAVLGTESHSAAQAVTLLETASREYDQRASRAETQTLYGSAAAILLLFSAFYLFYRRSLKARATAETLVVENQRLLAWSRGEAMTDALTGLGNRRALVQRLDEAVAEANPDNQVALALFDLDGFKQYNDTFGHPAGDMLLARLGARLAEALGDRATAFRMGGDEFCLLGRVEPGQATELALLGAEAFTENGEAFQIGCSWGIVLVPGEATTAEEALRLADQRMYERKAAGRTSASRQIADVLVQVMSERDLGLPDHLSGVARLARLATIELGLPEFEANCTRLAAELHDVGKAAVPQEILNKPGPLDAEELQFIRRHTLIGERILRAAPSLVHTADLVRSSHEWVDGSGYPDGLKGDEIPLGARIIAVCDAFDAMTSQRPYQDAMSEQEAIAELRRGAGTQFDVAIVDLVCELVAVESLAA
jgi:diguanylate cyclase (GGDEF)-like protein